MPKPITVKELKEILSNLDENSYLIPNDHGNVEVMLSDIVVGIIHMRPAGFLPQKPAKIELEINPMRHKNVAKLQ